jgi:hypothetical protein
MRVKERNKSISSLVVIDLGVRDSHRTRGWSGGARKESWHLGGAV